VAANGDLEIYIINTRWILIAQKSCSFLAFDEKNPNSMLSAGFRSGTGKTPRSFVKISVKKPGRSAIGVCITCARWTGEEIGKRKNLELSSKS